MAHAVATSTSAGRVYPPGAGAFPYTIIDVRAPVEVARGALPLAHNVPILSDEERHRVGIAYKEAGQQAAIELGYRLTRESMPERIASWRKICSRGPALFCCWRGGMRSRLAQEFLGEPAVATVAGGYKALRAHLMSGLELAMRQRRVLVLTGMTGTGKTDLLEALTPSNALLPLDLEGLAVHRGSAFGTLGRQPAQQTFENSLASQVVMSPAGTLLVEDEGRRIGKAQLPAALYERMTTASLLVLEAPREERIERIHRQYIVASVDRLGSAVALAQLKAATARLRRRLGGETVEWLAAVLDRAFQADEWRNVEALEAFITPLLDEYYDPLYRRAVEKMDRQVMLRGDREEILSWLKTRMTPPPVGNVCD